MNSEIKKVVERVKDAQVQLQGLIKGQDWVDEARKYAERQGKEVKKIIAYDVAKMKKFLETEQKALEKIQKQIPGEVKKFRKFVDFQKKEFEKLISSVAKMKATGPAPKAAKKAKGKKTVKVAKKKSSGQAAGSHSAQQI